ncbi:hypothetical protein PFISCL1PPCAC_6295 [Pristionchus fissidentatus]|uniref:peptidylprolyl isomerase n=1 Tax=Pristionchus fissidentatus TaxID=1538716 RepID=A0AAV5V9V8_9BILA|nr:hypothetical protein PFISCL1PPCAC_6295 [Pristionchus fissidentatus]
MVKRSAEEDENPSSSQENFKVPTLPNKEDEPPAKVPKVPTLKFESTYLRSIPSASQYEKSFMHRDVITHVMATQTDFIITASSDGHLKFWKKKYSEGVEFVKHFRCHLHAFAHICVNFNGTLLATACAEDKSIKIFDVENFDMINMIKLDFAPRTIAWIHQGADVINTLAISDSESGKIVIVDGKGTAEPIHTIENLHSKSVRCIEYNHKLDVAVSTDDAGMIEFWRGEKGGFEFPEEVVKWESKMDTDLYELLKVKTLAVCIQVSPKGDSFAVLAEDRRIRLFNYFSGKMSKIIDETLPKYIENGKTNRNFGLQSMEWNRRVAVERELDKDRSNSFRHATISYDLSGNFLLYPSITGIQVYNIVTDTVVRTIGQEETVRLSMVSICRAVPDVRTKLQGAATTLQTETADNPNLNKTHDPDPVMVCGAYRKNRFYLFTNAEPFSTETDEENGSGRDVFNEKPKKEDTITAVEAEKAQKALSTAAVIHTSMGDIHIELFPNECPKTVENFCTHARRGFYNGLLFHRVLKSFMIQTGDPTGRGTGGESIWGEDFEDEFHPRLRHDKPYRVSMANAGPNSNGSQFFITTVPAEWLDGKNTLFAEVTEGFNVVQKINGVPTHGKSGRPKDEIKLVSISLK